MIEQKSGNIVNITSLYASLVADYRMYEGRDIFNPVTYPVSKHGLVGLTKYIASFWAPHGIRCNCLSPGSFPNTISKKDDPSAPNSVEDDEFLNILNRKCSLGRTGVPQDLESAIQFLCSEKSSYLTGANLVVDGGWSVL
jgi:gluconate 5-dehydrogenase